MIKLYYSAGSCSTSCHISLEESGLKYEAIPVDFDNASDPNIALTKKLNPLGTLPLLITEDGKQLDQNLSIHCYIGDKAQGKHLLPAQGTFERLQVLNLLSFVAADLHKGIGALFGVNYMTQDKNIQSVVRKFYVDRAGELLSYMESKLSGKDYLMGKEFCVADAYAYVVTGWTKWLEIPLTPYKNIQNYMARITSRPAVAKVLKEEGLS
jgi:glutathione S-transferase